MYVSECDENRKFFISFLTNKNLSFVAKLLKPTLFGVASSGGYCGRRRSNYPDLFSDIRLPDVSDWIMNVTMFSRSENFQGLKSFKDCKSFKG